MCDQGRSCKTMSLLRLVHVEGSLRLHFWGMGRKLVVFEPDVCGCCRKVFGPFDSREAAAAFVDERRALRSLERGQPVRGWEMYFITSADESSALRPASGRRSRP